MSEVFGDGARSQRSRHVQPAPRTAPVPAPPGSQGRATPQPQLSVVIACRNAESTLGVQLTALADQVDPVPFEVILCDNGSTDGSVPLATSYQDRLDLRVVDASARRGPAFARNVGVAQARGPLVGFCDADDEVDATWVASMAAALRVHDFVAGRVGVERLNDPEIIGSRVMEQRSGLQPPVVEVGFEHAGTCNLGLHREAFLAVGGFDVDVLACEDTDFCMKMQLAGHRLRYDPEVLVHTRLRARAGPIVRQGYRYGVGQAQLERRYGVPQPRQGRSGGPGDPVGPAAPARRGAGRVARHLRVLRALPWSGRLWQVGWTAGHRIGRLRHRGVDPTPTPAATAGQPSRGPVSTS